MRSIAVEEPVRGGRGGRGGEWLVEGDVEGREGGREGANALALGNSKVLGTRMRKEHCDEEQRPDIWISKAEKGKRRRWSNGKGRERSDQEEVKERMEAD